jgi:GntR family transcriptional regulator/MocR family aminotransferase
MKNLRSTSRGPELLLLIALDRKSDEPLYRQLYLRLVELIMDGSLPVNGRLPSSRALAQKINVSRNTVVSAYQQLEVEGYVRAQRGSQTFVAAAPNRSTTHRIEEPKGSDGPLSKLGRQIVSQPMNFFGLAHRRSLQPGIPDVSHFPFVTLRRIIARRLQAGGDYVFGYQHIAGYPPLKRAISRYLAAARGVRCDPDQVVITNGAQPAFDLLARILTDPGDSVWMEDPGYPAAQSAFVAAGASIIALTVSAAGWELSAPPADGLRAIYVTPSCQSPLGVTMRLEQRLRLAEIARAHDAWIIKDDFDGEYRFFRQRRAGAARCNRGQSDHLCRNLFQDRVPGAARWLCDSAAQHGCEHIAGDVSHRPVRVRNPAGGARRFHRGGSLHNPSRPHAPPLQQTPRRIHGLMSVRARRMAGASRY